MSTVVWAERWRLMAIHNADMLHGLAATSFQVVPDDTHWHQVNVALVRHNGNALPSARALFGQLTPVLEVRRIAGRLHHWFFMRKPPDVRLRFRLREGDGATVDSVNDTLDALLTDGKIEHYSWSQYQPELKRFGGELTIDCAHASFSVDTLLWIQLDQLDACQQRTIQADQLLAAHVHHMFQCCCGIEHVVEPWQELGKLIEQGGISIAQAQPQLPETLEALAGQTHVSTLESAVLQTYRQSNKLLGHMLSGLASTTNLQLPVSTLVASIALFTFNRHGIDGSRSGTMTSQVLAALDAKV